MAPACKDSYAAALRAQIEARKVCRAADEEVAFAPSEGLFGRGAIEAPLLGSKRRHGAPPLPSKESYASALHEQMKTRSAQEAEASRIQVSQVDQEDVADELFGKGRRHGAPSAIPKNEYAAELQQQIAARKAKSAIDAELSAGERIGSIDAFSEQVDSVRGKRHASRIEAVSKASYNSELHEQMAEKSAQRAANSFHKQIVSDSDDAYNGREEKAKGGRRKCDLPPASKQSYALALQEQIAEHKLKQATQIGEAGQSCFVGGYASDMAPARGRRHVEQIPVTSKQQLGSYLQRQMAERECERAANQLQHLAEDSLECFMNANSDHASCANEGDFLCA
jgi:hypothetical protein